ncbi:MAG TPA: hypothetical protein VIH90_02110 [Candidatus Saccharimonadales bacterium]
MKLPKITTKQQDILNLLYRYRFLNRIQIQELIGHKDKERSRTFIDRSMLIADCCMRLEEVNTGNSNNKSKASYAFVTEADYIDPDSNYHFLAEHEVLRPNLCIVKTEESKDQDEAITTNYLLEIFDSTLPRYRLRHRLKVYVTYLDDNEWESEDPQPIILLVCPNLNDLIYAKRRVKKLFLDTYYEVDDIPKDISIRFTTTEQLQKHGISVQIWEEGRELLSL